MSLTKQEWHGKPGILAIFMNYAQEVKFMGPGSMYLHFFDNICLNQEEPLDPECEEKQQQNLELIMDGNIKEENGM